MSRGRNAQDEALKRICMVPLHTWKPAVTLSDDANCPDLTVLLKGRADLKRRAELGFGCWSYLTQGLPVRRPNARVHCPLT